MLTQGEIRDYIELLRTTFEQSGHAEILARADLEISLGRTELRSLKRERVESLSWVQASENAFTLPVALTPLEQLEILVQTVRRAFVDPVEILDHLTSRNLEATGGPISSPEGLRFAPGESNSSGQPDSVYLELPSPTTLEAVRHLDQMLDQILGEMHAEADTR